MDAIRQIITQLLAQVQTATAPMLHGLLTTLNTFLNPNEPIENLEWNPILTTTNLALNNANAPGIVLGDATREQIQQLGQEMANFVNNNPDAIPLAHVEANLITLATTTATFNEHLEEDMDPAAPPHPAPLASPPQAKRQITTR